MVTNSFLQFLERLRIFRFQASQPFRVLFRPAEVRPVLSLTCYSRFSGRMGHFGRQRLLGGDRLQRRFGRVEVSQCQLDKRFLFVRRDTALFYSQRD